MRWCWLWVGVAVLACVSARADSVPTWPDLQVDAGMQGGGEADAALVVGVGGYYNLPPIPGAVDNATAWQQWLLRSRKVKPERVVLLADREATTEKITKNLAALAAEVGRGGTLWFIFIGHGAPSQSGDDGLLLGVDTDADADSLSSRSVSQARVLSLVAGGRQSHSVVLFDACFSGRTGDGSQVLVAGLQATLPNRRRSDASTTTTVLSASDSFAGPLPGGGRPAFSYLMLGALRGWADEDGDRDVDVDEAYAFTRGTIQALFKGADRLPSRRGPSVVLATRIREPRPDLAALLSGRCPPAHRWDGGQCVALPKVQCPGGTSWDGSACVSACPAGTNWSGGACVALTVSCPAGTSWNGRACEGLCPSGTAWNGRSCAATAVECPAGTSWNGTACEGQRVAAASQPTRSAPAAPSASTSIDWVRSQGLNIARTETTVAQYRACVRAGACSAPDSDGTWSSSPGSIEDHPVTSVDWHQATAFCGWVGGRLPTADEWQRVASNGGTTEYPWGDAAPDGSLANYNGPDRFAKTSPACSFPAGHNRDGVCDLAGNVWKWTASEVDSGNKEMRGGSWNFTPAYLRASNRLGVEPARRNVILGFRCAQ